MPWDRLSPRPVPLATGFVVKKGSKTRGRFSGEMPGTVILEGNLDPRSRARSGDRDPTVVPERLHRLACVGEDVEENLLELMGIGMDGRELVGQVSNHLDVIGAKIVVTLAPVSIKATAPSPPSRIWSKTCRRAGSRCRRSCSSSFSCSLIRSAAAFTSLASSSIWRSCSAIRSSILLLWGGVVLDPPSAASASPSAEKQIGKVPRAERPIRSRQTEGSMRAK